ncbi:MAG: P13 family porin [Spirochaetales bacterium]|nr:P13 family porin [Spirochaetales bacterium]
MKKKALIIMIVALLCAGALFADAYKDVNKYINSGLSDKNLQMVAELSPQLTQEQKESIYRWKHVPVVMPFMMNTFLGFGSGSFNQGDDGMGILFLAGDTLCTGIIIYDIMATGWDNFIKEIGGKGGAGSDLNAAKIALIAAAGLRVWQAIRPFTYANSKNAKLKTALGLDEVSVAFAPMMTDDGMGFVLSAKIPLD